jgi:hypothetical protein
MNPAVDQQALQSLLDRPTDDLYSLLVPESARRGAYSEGGLVARGRTIFVRALKVVRATVCLEYTRRGPTVKNTVDIAGLVAGALLAAPIVANIPLLPLAALITKIGLEEVCHGWKPEG